MIRTVVYFTENSGFGGTEQMLLALLAGLDRKRWRPVLAYRSAADAAELLRRARKLDVHVWSRPVFSRGKRDMSCVPEFARRLRAERTAVFHAHRTLPADCMYALLSAAYARVPAIVATQHIFVGSAPKHRLLQHLQQKILSMVVDRYVAVSHEVARLLGPACVFSKGKIQVIQNGVPVGRFDRPADPSLRAALAPTGRPIVLSVARLESAHKGLPYLLEAAVQVPEAEFVLAGDGRDRPALEAQARDLGIEDRVRFLGHRDDVPELLASCDVFVLPSLIEGLPVAPLEAMAAGKPVVASAVGGTDEVVLHGKTGLLVPPRDPAALAGAIRAVLSDPALAARLAAAGKARVREEFSTETMVERTTRVYEELLSAREGSGRRLPAASAQA